ncbi:hypothetical protein [Paracoccus sp. SSK6]|uniref:hypothetical protein n=1 Tax=Paracoccus sp. SSK6 TaxID=3143131 RepID=UPI0032199F06
MALSFAPIAIGALIALTAATSAAKANWEEATKIDPLMDYIVSGSYVFSDQKSFLLQFICFEENGGEVGVHILNDNAFISIGSDTIEYRIDKAPAQSVKLIRMSFDHLQGPPSVSKPLAESIAQGSKLAIRFNGVADTFDMSEAEHRLERFLAGCPKVEPMAYGPQQPTGN